MRTIYETEPVKIGKHLWRVIVYVHKSYGTCTEYQYRRDDGEDYYWHVDTTWPSYNSNDGEYAGLPKSLAKRLYYPNEQTIKKALATPVFLHQSPSDVYYYMAN